MNPNARKNLRRKSLSQQGVIGLMFGVHTTLMPDKLSNIVRLRKQGKITCPEGIRIIEEYVWGLKFLVVIVEAEDLGKVMDFAQQFSRYTTDLEVEAVTTLKDLAHM
jgi:hypothetical protein